MSVQDDLLLIGIIILVVSLISGILGVMMAIVQHDLKRLLAYHSIENIGIIGIGIGLGMIGLATDNTCIKPAWVSAAGCFMYLIIHCSNRFFSSMQVRYIRPHIHVILSILGG